MEEYNNDYSTNNFFYNWNWTFHIFKKNKRQRKFKITNCSHKTYGKVINLIEKDHLTEYGRKKKYWHGVFEYNINGFKFTKESSVGSSSPKYTIGQDVEIYYNPNNYEENYIVGDTIFTSFSSFIRLLGIIFIVVAILTLIPSLLFTFVFNTFF